MNEQTIHVTFPGSSTLEFTNLKNVPVYEPAYAGWIHLHYTTETITKIDTWGQVTRLNVKTGRVERWYTRVDIASVVTMNMREGIRGYYYEFAKDGSIRSSSPEGAYYWGPVTFGMKKDPYEEHATVRDYMVEGYGDEMETLQDLHARFLADRELYNEDDVLLTPVERYGAMEQWRDALKARVENLPANKEMYEQCIRIAEKEIERLGECSECRRSGVCMCYT